MALMGHGTFNSNKIFNNLINRIQKKVGKKTQQKVKTPKKPRPSSKMSQNVYHEVLSAWFKFQAKIPTRSGMFRKSDKKKTTVPPTLFSKDGGLKGIGHSMGLEIEFWLSIALRFHI